MVEAPLPAAAPAIYFSGVAKRFGRSTVLEELSFSVAEGEFFGLVGVNGAGKTTSLKGLLDFSEMDAGEIEIFGVSHRLIAARERLAYLPERFLPPYYLTGRDFLEYSARLHGVEADASILEGLCGSLDLEIDTLARPVRQYSKGMAQKLGLIACFLSGKELYILDEPMSGLDPKARILVKRYFGELRARKRTVFFSTHLLTDVESLCDRMGILHGGRLRFVGTPEACRQQYGGSLEQAYLACISTS